MYQISGRVRFSEVDHTKKITLPSVINYFQDCSIFQSEDLGLGLETMKRHGRAWVLHAWQIVIKEYPVLGKSIQVGTWATGFHGLYGTRNFQMTNSAGKQYAYANSVWLYLDLESGRPIRPEERDIAGYEVADPLPMEPVSRKMKRPVNTISGDAFPVRSYHIDTNEHVNNSQYIQMALDVLPFSICPLGARVEYKKAAVLGDMIYPGYIEEDGVITTELCNESGKPFALVEFTEYEKKPIR